MNAKEFYQKHFTKGLKEGMSTVNMFEFAEAYHKQSSPIKESIPSKVLTENEIGQKAVRKYPMRGHEKSLIFANIGGKRIGYIRGFKDAIYMTANKDN